MKRWMVLLMLGLFITGCGQLARESEFWDHSSMYKDWDHLHFSLGGYKNCDADDVLQSKRDGWWGITMPCGVVPAVAPAPSAAANEPAVAPAKEPEKEKAKKKETTVKKKKKAKKSRKAKTKKIEE